LIRSRLATLVLAASLPFWAAMAQAPAAAPQPTLSPPRALVAPDVPSGDEAARVAALRTQALAFVEAFGNTNGLFTRDGMQVAFVSSRTGLNQPWIARLGAPAAAARRLVEWPERVVLDATTPDGRWLLFRSDKGADENWSIYRVGLGGGAPVELTPGETMQREAAVVAEFLPGTVFFTGRRMSDASSILFSVPLEGGAVREIYRDPKPASLSEVSRDGRQALVVRYPTISDNQLLVVEVATGKARQVYPAEGRKVSIMTASWSPDARVIYVCTDGGGERAMVLRLDAATGAETGRYLEPGRPSQYDSSLVSRAGDTVALAVDRGNESIIRLLDARSLKTRARVRLPAGQGQITDLSQDGRRLLVTWSTPGSPSDLWSVDTRTGAATRLRQEPRPTLAKLPRLSTTIVEVKAHDGLALPVNVYLPARPKGKLPVIVAYHGGPSGSSKVRWSATTAFFVAQGWAWVEPNVRGSGGFGRSFEEADNGPGRLAAFRDIETTGRWAADQAWADPSRVVIFGGSYGGYTVLVGLTRMPGLWRAGVDLFGIASVPSFMAATSGVIRELFLVEFGDPEKDLAFLESISPLRDVGRIASPLFVYAGANDPRVPRSESDLIVQALRDRKVPVEYMVADDEGHSLARRATQVDFMARAARFLERHVERAPAPPLKPAPKPAP